MEIISYEIVFIATAIGILPLAIWLLFIYQKSSIHNWEANFLLMVFFVGVLTAIPASILEILFIESGGNNIIESAIKKVWLKSDSILFSPNFLTLISAAAIEEITKGLGIAFLSFKKGKGTVNNGILIGILVGLSFAITENGVYFATIINNQTESLFQIVLLRFIISTTAHIVYSGLMGYYLYRLLLNSEKKIKMLFMTLTAPFLIHFFFNYLLGTPLSWGIILIIFGGIFILYWLYQKNKEAAYEV